MKILCCCCLNRSVQAIPFQWCGFLVLPYRDAAINSVSLVISLVSGSFFLNSLSHSVFLSVSGCCGKRWFLAFHYSFSIHGIKSNNKNLNPLKLNTMQLSLLLPAFDVFVHIYDEYAYVLVCVCVWTHSSYMRRIVMAILSRWFGCAILRKSIEQRTKTQEIWNLCDSVHRTHTHSCTRSSTSHSVHMCFEHICTPLQPHATRSCCFVWCWEMKLVVYSYDTYLSGDNENHARSFRDWVSI